MYKSGRHNYTPIQGFSLVELIVAIALIGILMSIATSGFNQWQTKSRVESQVKQMVTDIGALRIRALTTKQRQSITLYPTSYVFKSYSSESLLLTAGTILPGGTHNVTYRLKKDATTNYTGTDIFEIDSRGILPSTKATIFLDYKGSAAIDCITIHTVRVNPGKKNTAGDTCNDQ
jgi:prepilin-type N-terminal cleavage/methylation domain-containing protein